MRVKDIDMVSIDIEKLKELDSFQSLNNLALAIGCNRNYLSTAMTRGRINKNVLSGFCRYYKRPVEDFIVENQPKNTKKKEAENILLELLSEHESKVARQLEEMELKTDRDIAELRKLATSLQVQIEQLKMERRTV